MWRGSRNAAIAGYPTPTSSISEPGEGGSFFLKLAEAAAAQGLSSLRAVNLSTSFDWESRCLDAHTARAQAPGMSTRNGMSVRMRIQIESDKARGPSLLPGARGTRGVSRNSTVSERPR